MSNTMASPKEIKTSTGEVYFIDIQKQKDNTFFSWLYYNGVYCSCSFNHFLTLEDLNKYIEDFGSF